MTALNWQKDRQRQVRREVTGEKNYAQAVNLGRSLRKREQALYRNFVQTHRHEHSYVADVARQVDQGRPITKGQAAVLQRIATERGWPLTVKSTPARDRAKGGGQAGRAILQEARRAAEQYVGPNRWLQYVQRDYLGDPGWLPKPATAAKILREVANPDGPVGHADTIVTEWLAGTEAAATTGPGADQIDRGADPF